MATYTNINGDFTLLKTVLENSGLFESVTDGTFRTGTWTYTHCVICKANGKSGFFKYGWMLHGGFYVNLYGLAVNQGLTPCYEFVPDYSSGKQDDYFPVAAYVTANGVSIVCRRARILITRNQNGKVVVVTGANEPAAGSTTDSFMSRITALSVYDDAERRAFPVNTEIGFQTMIIPVCTASSELSYTDKAGLLAYKQSNAVGNILYGDKRYFTDGYFAIEDPEPAS